MTNSTDYQPVPSPCIGICTLDDKKVCRGCYRTSEEITYWRLYSDEERQVINERLRRMALERGLNISSNKDK